MEGIFLARDMINTPAEDMGPEEIAAEAVAMAQHHGAEVAIIVGDDLLTSNFPAIHTVGRASSRYGGTVASIAYELVQVGLGNVMVYCS